MKKLHTITAKTICLIFLFCLLQKSSWGQTTYSIPSSSCSSCTNGTYSPADVCDAHYTALADIYPSGSLAFGSVTKIAFDQISGSQSNVPVKIYLKSTSASTLTAGTWTNAISGATLVYNGNVSFTSSGWVTVTLTTAYTYSANNLEVLVECDWSSTTTCANNPIFYYYTASGNSDEYWETSAGTTAANLGNETGTVDNGPNAVQVTITPSCTAPTITGTTPASRCGTGTVTLGATASSGTINWYAASTGGSSLGTGATYTTTSISSTTTYYVDATANSCTTPTRTAVTATINAIPTITGTTPASRCGTGTVTLGATASAGTINWYAASTGGSSLGTGTTYTTTSISSTTTYYVDATANSCTTGSRTSVTATINPNNAVSVSIAAGPSATICSGTSVTFTATPTNGGASPSYQWKKNGSNVGTNSTTYTNASLVNNDAITCVLTSNVSCPTGNPATSNSIAETVNANNAVSVSIAASPSGAICAGTSVQFTATPTNGGSSPSYQWKKNGSNVGTNSTTYTNASLANNDVITCVLTSNVSCPTGNPATSNSITETVNTYSQPVSATWALASNANASASNLTATTGTLTGATSQGFATCNSNTGWSASNWQNDITSSYSKYYEFSITPNAGSNLTITSISYGYNAGGFSNCSAHQNEVESFYSTNSFSSSTALQSLSMGTGGAWDSYSNSGLAISVPDGTTLKIRVAFDQNNAGDNSIRNYIRNLVISGTSGSAPTISASASTICAGQSVTLTAGGGSTYNWSTGATTTSITVSPTVTTTYTVTATNSIGCTATAVQTITVNALPSAAITASPSFTICNGQGTTLTASGGASYIWNTGATTSVLGVTPANTTSYSVTVTSSAGCTASITKTVTVNPVPTPTVTASPSSTICSGNSLTLNASGANTYVWNPGGATTASVNVSPTANTTYTLTGTSLGCSANAAISITVNPTPTVSISGADSLCAGQSTLLIASGGNTYLWSTSATTSAITVSPASTTTYSVTATNSFGCTAAASHAVAINLACNTRYGNGGNPPPFDPALEVGTTPGSFAVSQNGAATYDISLLVPPGTAGMVPHLSVSYNSHGGDGLLGTGWSLSGLSSISRTTKSEYYNGGYGTTAPVTLTNSDNFVLDGSHLIPVTGNNGENATYGTEMETFARINSFAQTVNGPDYFLVEAKDGSILRYGYNADSRIEASGSTTKVLTWLLDKVTDNKGNYITISYIENNTTGEFYPDRMDYTGNSSAGLSSYNYVKFIYNSRADKRTFYEAGHQLQQNVLLSSLEMMALGNKVHEYDFNYSNDLGLGSHLSEVIEKGTDNKKFNSTKIVWGNITSNDLKPIEHPLPFYQGTSDSYAADVNGDGYSDLIELSNNGWTLLLNNFPASGFSSPATNSFGFFSRNSQIKNSNNPYNLGGVDLNGDGYDDMIIFTPYDALHSFTSPSFRYYLSNYPNGEGLTEITSANAPLIPQVTASSGTNNSFTAYTFGDFDGDGTKDLFVYYSNGQKWYVYSFKTSVAVKIAEGVQSNPYWEYYGPNNTAYDPALHFIQLFPTDMNGDGKDEIAVLGDYDSNSNPFHVYELTTSGTLSQLYTSTYPDDFTSDALFPADFNGDGKTDLLAWQNSAPSNSHWKISFSTGTSFITNSTAINLSDYSYFNSGDPVSINKHQIFVTDFSGDGKADIIEKTTTGNSGDGTDFRTLYGTGTGINFIEDDTHFTNTYFPSADATNASNCVGDFNGDGHLDIMLHSADITSGSNKTIFTFLENKNNHKVHQIINGLGAAITVDYSTLQLLAKQSSPAQYTKDHQAVFPLNDFQNALTVVASTEQDNGVGGTNTTDYNYSGAQVHLQGKGFLGFNSVASTNTASGIKTEHTYSLPDAAHFFQRTLSKTDQSSLTGGPISERTFTYTEPFITGAGLPLGADPSGLRYYFYANSVIDNDLLHGNTTTTSPIIQDIYGNTTNETSTNAAVTSVVQNGFAQVDAWLPSRLNSMSTTVTRGSSSYVRSSSITSFNNSGQPLTKIDDTGLETDLMYDAFGNVTYITEIGAHITTRTTHNVYDQPYNRFAITQTNPIGSVHATYDDVYGNIISKTDLNGLTTNYTYDGFGRMLTTVTPTNQTINVARAWDNSVQISNGTSLFSTTTTENGMPTNTQYFDELGRNLRDQTVGFNGSDIVKADKAYNNIGQLIKQYVPYISSSGAFTSYSSFDAFLRPTTIINANGATSTISYSGNSTTVQTTTNNGTKASTKVLDASGSLVSVTDDGGTITYAYHGCGKPKSITPPASSVVTMDYDAFGRQKQFIDRDAGEMDYEYDELGELTKQTDAKGNIYTLTYDGLGRVISQTGSDNSVITYTYDDVNGKGKIDKITGSTIAYNGIVCDYDYDSQSRLSAKTETIDGTPYKNQYSYDALSRCTTEVYPGINPFSVNIAYNSTGYLHTINDASNNPIWTCNNVNQFGQVTSALQGNSGTISKTYNSLGLLQNITSVETSQTAMNTDYNFDATTGNLLSRTDNIYTQNEAFSYDNPRDRLTDIYQNNSVSPVNSTSYLFGANIASKTDVGYYQYSGALPHAISAIENLAPTVDTTKQNITYTPFNKADNINEGIFNLQFYYGPQKTRKKSVLTNTHSNTIVRTVINDGDYEKVSVGSDVYELNYINTPDGLVAIGVKHNGAAAQLNYVHTDHLGSIMSLYDASGSKVYEQSFDAWGKERDPGNWANANPNTAPAWLIRGYTGHEHHKEFGLINMNGRMYDPLLGRMLSPDNVVSAPDFTDSYNRYSYVMNNPLKYTDPTGMLMNIYGGTPPSGWNPIYDSHGWLTNGGGDFGGYSGGGEGGGGGPTVYVDGAQVYGSEADAYTNALTYGTGGLYNSITNYDLNGFGHGVDGSFNTGNAFIDGKGGHWEKQYYEGNVPGKIGSVINTVTILPDKWIADNPIRQSGTDYGLAAAGVAMGDWTAATWEYPPAAIAGDVVIAVGAGAYAAYNYLEGTTVQEWREPRHRYSTDIGDGGDGPEWPKWSWMLAGSIAVGGSAYEWSQYMDDQDMNHPMPPTTIDHTDTTQEIPWWYKH